MSPPPNRDFQEWWNKQREKNHDLFEDKPVGPTRSFLTVDIQTVPSDLSVEKGHARSARQLSWLRLLRFQQIASSLAWVSNGFLLLLRTANRRIASPDSRADSASSRLYRVIKVFLVVILLLLVFELVAYFNGWHFSPPSARPADVSGMIGLVYAKWLEIWANYLAPPLQSLTNVGTDLFLVLSIDRVILILGCCWIIFRRLKPVAAMEYPTDAEEQNNCKKRRRGEATDSHSLAERVRREKISERMKLLQDLVPGCKKATSKALVLDEIINYVKSLQRQVEFLSLKLASVNARLDFNTNSLISKDIFQSNNPLAHPIFPLDSSAQAFYGHHTQRNPAIHNNILNGAVTDNTVDPLETASLCQNLGMQLPPLNGFNEGGSQFPLPFCEDDLHTIVEMGYGQTANRKSPTHSQNFNSNTEKRESSNQVSHMKVEL